MDPINAQLLAGLKGAGKYGQREEGWGKAGTREGK